MELEPAARKRGRPRKRRRIYEDNKEAGPDPKKQALEARPKAFVGRYVLKEFEGNGIFLGKIVYYDTGLYRVDYEDGDCEDLESGELRLIALEENEFDKALIARRKKLDEWLLKNSAKRRNRSQRNAVGSTKVVEPVEAPPMIELSGEPTTEDDWELVDGGVDSSDFGDRKLEPEAPLIPQPQLPPSSGTVGVPEEYVSHLFSVYRFLRSFSICLFLSPFGLNDLVGSLNCVVPNYLLDAIHVALMRALRRHPETLSSDGLELASKCLRCIDWSLLDSLTWPFYLIQYLTVMGHATGPEWKGFYINVLEREYYSLPVSWKLIVLQLLCDDVLQSAEIRADIDMREESEVGIDDDAAATTVPANVPRRVHPKYSKTSACKDGEAMEIISKNHEMQPPQEVDVDANGDECRLCGMDGTLLCCDGCPSAYHSRCIGVIKMYMPEGSWYCPECTINKIEPAITTGTFLKGAELFGVDSYEQVFLGTCNHLLVLRASINKESGLRYYNQNDIPKVLQSLNSSVEHKTLYAGISNSILQYWDISENILPIPEANVNDGAMSKPSICAEKHDIGEHKGNAVLTCPQTSLDASVQTDCHTTAIGVNANDSGQQSDISIIKSAISVGTVNQQAVPSDLTHQSLAEKLCRVTGLATCTSGNSSGRYAVHANSRCLPENNSSQSKKENCAVLVNGDGTSSYSRACVYMGPSFKPHAYINQYMQGDFAASAAANLAMLSSEEKKASEVHAFTNPRKAVSAIISLQTKAFSLSATRFFWPSSEKRLFEVPRERCGWCYSCKSTIVSKRGCMLNAAASSATKGAMKFLAGTHSLKSGNSILPSITMYILYIEESLRGLIVGSFRCGSYRKQWHKQAEQASTFSKIKSLLLELERNVRVIAFSGDWVKLVDNWLAEPAAVQNATSTNAVQKRGPSGRRGRKPSAMTSDTTDGCKDKSFSWWRGGKLSKFIFQKGILPNTLIKKAARQGGWNKIPGIYYTDGSEVPKRSRQLVWRAAVEASRNASQLAFQVRYLDHHIRWSDLVRSEIILQDGKCPETEASAFRNAIVCDKKIVEKKTRYGVVFNNQKHLLSRIMKNIIETEQREDGKEMHWFLEMRIPLYLIKEYEERSKSSDEMVLPSAKNSLTSLSSFQRRQLKDSRKDIFSYLDRKRNNMDTCFCASCQLDVLLRNAVKCSACEGYCHSDCTVNSTVSANDASRFLPNCKRCYYAKNPAQNPKAIAKPLALTAPNGSKLNGLGQPSPPVRTLESSEMKRTPIRTLVVKQTPIRTQDRSLVVKQTPIRTQDRSSVVKQTPTSIHPEVKQATSDSKLTTKSRHKIRSWGIIFHKKGITDNGTEFRRQNIITRDTVDMKWLKPECYSCRLPYDPDLTYIHCETCKNWFHTVALELEDSKLSDVVGFKCCRCRRITRPVCPYKEPDGKKIEYKKASGKQSGETVSKQENSGVESVSGTTCEVKEYEPTTPMFPMEEAFIKEEDPFLTSLSRVEPVTDHNSELDLEWNNSGPQKLPVRRQVKREGEANGNDLLNAGSQELNRDKEPSPCLDWNARTDGEMIFDYDDLNFEDMEFEPQTYFSFTELLPSEGGGGGASSQNCWDISSGEIVGTFDDQVEPKKGVECGMCSQMEVAPDLCCQICGLQIHSHCSPWDDSSYLPGGGSWSCGGCREWR